MSDTFGKILINHQNAMKFTDDKLSEKSNIKVADIQELKNGNIKPTIQQIDRLANALGIRIKDLLPTESDTRNGIKITTSKDSENTRRLVNRQAVGRDSKLYYSYQDTALTINAPYVRGVILDIFCLNDEDIVQNEGHFQDSITFVTKGPIQGVWVDDNGKVVTKKLETGHSYFARGYAPHTYRSYSQDCIGQILSFTFCNALAADTQSDLMMLGEERSAEHIKINSPYGNLIYWHINNSLHDIDSISEITGIDKKTFIDIENGKITPSFSQLEIIADALCISVSEIMPTITDTNYGTKHWTPKQSQSTKREVKNENEDVIYEVCDLAKTTELSNLRTHRIKVIQKDVENAKCDLSSNKHTMLFVYKGSGLLKWICNDEVYTTPIEEYDSIYIEPLVKYSIINTDEIDILHYLYPTNVTGDAMKELFYKGKNGAKRIANESMIWCAKQTEH